MSLALGPAIALSTIIGGVLIFAFVFGMSRWRWKKPDSVESALDKATDETTKALLAARDVATPPPPPKEPKPAPPKPELTPEQEQEQGLPILAGPDTIKIILPRVGDITFSFVGAALFVLRLERALTAAEVMRGERDDLFDDDEPKKDAECGAGDKP